MTMFSMKPKFDLAAFLAEPAKPGSFRRRGMTAVARPPAPAEAEATGGTAAPSA
jgi:hypothetical protein